MEGPPSFPVPKSWADIEQAVRGLDNPDEAWAIFQAYMRACAVHQFGEEGMAALDKDQKLVMLQKAAGAAVWIRENDEQTFQAPEFHFATVNNMRLAWKAVMDGHDLPIPDYEPPEPPSPEVDEEAAKLADDGVGRYGGCERNARPWRVAHSSSMRIAHGLPHAAALDWGGATLRPV